MKNCMLGLLLAIPWLAAVFAAVWGALHDKQLMAMLETVTSIFVVVIYTVSLAAALLFFINTAGVGFRMMFKNGKQSGGTNAKL